MKALGRAAGIPCCPHALRHHGITRLLDLGAGLRDVQKFSRHADVRVLQRYDDHRADVGGQLARRLAEQY